MIKCTAVIFFLTVDCSGPHCPVHSFRICHQNESDYEGLEESCTGTRFKVHKPDLSYLQIISIQELYDYL